MGQEFHVLRCFSCEVFQVQQVKKSKRWVCKVCGEKQSLLKEFGRGGAADCRRHVQKLNALRGRLQEVTPGSQWDQDDGSENEAVDEGQDGDVMDNSQQEVSPHVSRWSKYTGPTAQGPDEDEDEELNISTERQGFRSQGSRKRKKSCTLKSSAGTRDVCEDEEASAAGSGVKRPDPPVQQDRRLGSAWSKGSASCVRSDDVEPCRSTDLPSSRSSTHNPGNDPQHVDKSLVSFGSSASRWNKFLPVVSSQRDEDEDDYQVCNSNSVMPRFTEALVHTGVDREERSLSSNTQSSKPLVSEPPPPARTPCPKLSFNPMFLTDEDFDDTF